MQVLHLSDTHLGAELRARGAPRGWSRADEHLGAMETALAPALAEEVDLVVHTGDLFDRSQPPREAVAAAAVLLSRVARRVPVLLSPGNHDRRGLLPHLHGTPGLHIFDAPGRFEHRGAAFGLVPYAREAQDWSAAAREAVGPGVDLLFAHQSFHGARVPGFRFRVGHIAETVGAEHLPPGLRLVASGHIHTRQILYVGEARVVHGGSTERTSYAEEHETKSYTVFTLGATTAARFVDLPTRPMRWITHPDQIAQIRPEELVGLARDLRTVELEEAALARGAWLTGRPARAPLPSPRDEAPPAQRQGSLF